MLSNPYRNKSNNYTFKREFDGYKLKNLYKFGLIETDLILMYTDKMNRNEFILSSNIWWDGRYFRYDMDLAEDLFYRLQKLKCGDI